MLGLFNCPQCSVVSCSHFNGHTNECVARTTYSIMPMKKYKISSALFFTPLLPFNQTTDSVSRAMHRSMSAGIGSAGSSVVSPTVCGWFMSRIWAIPHLKFENCFYLCSLIKLFILTTSNFTYRIKDIEFLLPLIAHVFRIGIINSPTSLKLVK